MVIREAQDLKVHMKSNFSNEQQKHTTDPKPDMVVLCAYNRVKETAPDANILVAVEKEKKSTVSTYRKQIRMSELFGCYH